MRAQPTPQERPKAFHGVYVHFAQAVPIFIACKLASPMVDTLMVVAPGLQTGINAVLVRIYTCACNDGVFDERLNGLLLHIRQQIDDHLPTALHHPKNGWPLFLQGPTATVALEPTATSLSALAPHHLRLAFMTRNHIGFVALH